MSGETQICVVGNMVADADLRFIPSGAAVANFTIASTPRTFDKQRNEWVDGEALFLRCAAWKQLGENVAESLTKGTQVIVQGRLKSRSYETKEGEKRTSMELEVDAVGPSLQFATATVNRVGRGGGQSRGQSQGAGGGFNGQQQGGFGGGQQSGGWDTQQAGGFGAQQDDDCPF